MIVAIGEVVWDIFPDRQALGGAPINVAYHLKTLGVDVGIITRVGRDELGDRTIGSLAALGLPLDGVQRGEEPTGRVKITFDENNVHHFEIVSPAAWDNIGLDESLAFLDGLRFDLVFGTLAQRGERSRRTIREVWKRAGRKLYDVNLRPPYTSDEVVRESLAAADLVKMNGDELVEIAGWHDFKDADGKRLALALMDRYNIAVLVVTEGADGAWVLDGKDYFRDPGRKVEVADTVGAGDAFFATLLAGYTAGEPWPDVLARANERGAYVASQNGATPKMPA